MSCLVDASPLSKWCIISSNSSNEESPGGAGGTFVPPPTGGGTFVPPICAWGLSPPRYPRTSEDVRGISGETGGDRGIEGSLCSFPAALVPHHDESHFPIDDFIYISSIYFFIFFVSFKIYIPICSLCL